MKGLSGLTQVSCLLLCTSTMPSVLAQDTSAVSAEGPNTTSPVRKIDRPKDRPRDREDPNARLRSFDGSGNNLSEPEMNRADTPLGRWVAPAYGDLVATLAGEERPSARFISNSLSAQSESIPNSRGASDFLWQWGQFIDHDIDLTDGVDPAELANISIPVGDAWFDPTASGERSMTFNRSLYDPASGTGSATPRAQLNEISGWIDASQIYGSDADRASALRTHDGTGRLRTSAGNLLPFNDLELANAGGSGPNLFLAGDVRANEQVGLTVMHTLFVREHNRLVGELARREPDLSGPALYQRARRIVGAHRS